MKVCTTCGETFSDTERFCPRDGTALRAQETGNELIGAVIADRYHIQRKLGEGGMGQVYLAEHVRMKRRSAVKVIHPAMTKDHAALGRFSREASNACQIQHPNVAAIYDFGESPDGLVYLAMEYVEGESLARLLSARGPLPPERVADIARQIADGLEAAHRLGIVHRDLKPDNILIGRHYDGRDAVKVVDFGISKAARGEGQSVTESGQVIGTPDYMSPEQLSGDPVDHRSDVYALAIVAFNMLTGVLPFQSTSSQKSMVLRLIEPPMRLAQARPDVAWPPALQRVLDRAMDIDVFRRHQSASEFASDIAQALDGMAAVAPVSTDAATVVTALPLPPSAPTAARPGLSTTELSSLETRLAKAVGPIAKVLVKRAAASAPSRDALIAALASEIDDEQERERFRRHFA